MVAKDVDNVSYIECLFYSSELIISRVLQVKILGLRNMSSFFLSQNYRYILARSPSQFFINYSKVFENSILENTESNEDARTCTY